MDGVGTTTLLTKNISAVTGIRKEHILKTHNNNVTSGTKSRMMNCTVLPMQDKLNTVTTVYTERYKKMGCYQSVAQTLLCYTPKESSRFRRRSFIITT